MFYCHFLGRRLFCFDLHLLNRKGKSSVNNEDQRPVAYQQLKVDAPANDGSMITEFGDGVKMSLFRCMCEERKMNDESDTTNKVDEEKEENEGNQNLRRLQ